MSEKITGENAEALKLLQSFAGTILDKPDDEIASLMFDEDGVVKKDFLSTFKTIHSDHLEATVSKYKGQNDEGYKRGQKETLTKAEKQFNIDHGYEGDEPLVERFKNVLERDKAKAVEGLEGNEITEVEAKKTKWYSELLDEFEALATTHQEEKDELTNSFTQVQVQSKVKDLLLREVKGLKPVYNKDPLKAATQEMELIERINRVNWGIKDSQLIILNKDGTEALNDQHFRFKPDEEIKKIVLSQYDLDASGNNSPPASGGGSQGGKATDIKGIETKDQLMKAMMAATQESYKAQGIKNKEKREEALTEAQDRIDKLHAHGKELNLT